MKTIFLILACLISSTYGANILFYFGFSTYSHRITVWPLVEALVEKGHSVTFLQPAVNKSPNPKVKEIVPDIGDTFGPINFMETRLKLGPNAIALFVYQLPWMAATVCNATLSDPKVQKWINANKFDLVVIDALYNDCGLGLAHKWGAKTAIFATTSVFEWHPDTYGFPAESSCTLTKNHHQNVTSPVSLFDYTKLVTVEDHPLSFFGRLVSTLGHLYFRFIKVGIHFPKIEPILREKLNLPNMPSLLELEAKTNLVLINTHFTEEHARSLPPMYIPIGGMHCTEKTKPLPKEIEDFINKNGENGFIYVSFGSGAQISKAPQELRNIFYNTFKNTKMPVIWKWEGKRPSEMPENVYTAEWMPQQAILSHPKIRLFITHGGLLSMQEALFNAVPMISFPIFADQDYNSERLQRTKRGIRLEITQLTQPEFENAIKQILTDPVYKNNVKQTSIVFKDRPMKPLDTAVWWVEYILRHKDTSHLQPLAISQHWWQRRLLDVWAFILFSIILIIVINILIIKKLLSCCFGSSSSSSRTTTSSASKKNKVKKN